MHSVTLSFATLAELAAAVGAVERFQTKVDGPAKDAPAPAPAPVKPKAADKPKGAELTAAQEKAIEKGETVEVSKAQLEKVVADATKAAADAVDYPTLQKAVFRLAGVDREAVKAVAATFGLTTFKDSPSDIWGKALAAVNAKIEELAAVA